MSSSNEPVTKATFWQQHIQQWKTAQQTQIAYCQAHSLNVPQFNYWIRKERSANAQKNKKVTFPSLFIPRCKISERAIRSFFELTQWNDVVRYPSE